jgi:molybdopterin molybdotransferase
MNDLPQIGPIQDAVFRLADRLDVVSIETIKAEDCGGRVLSDDLGSDRDSPAIDVSAMDGYAVRIHDVTGDPIAVSGTIPAGSPPQPLPIGKAIRIFTGAPVPPEADCIVRREDTLEHAHQVTIHIPASALQTGQNIRRRGENAPAGSVVLPKGTWITPAAMGAIATFAPSSLQVRKRVRTAVLNTGDELADIGQAVEPWQIRDSNGPLLETWLKQLPWVEFVGRQHVSDTLESAVTAIENQLPNVDAILLTGGVSMGDTDHVPAAIEQLGGAISFHRLPIRPGKPILGASIGGKLLLGLPGNPVSVAVTSRVLGLPLLRKVAGFASIANTSIACNIDNPDDKSLDLIWYRLVTIDDNGRAKLLGSQGSGDLVSLAISHGFVEIPSGMSGQGPWKLTYW